MNKLKTFLLKLVRGLVVDLIERALEMAVIELNSEIDDNFNDLNERETLKSGIEMLQSQALEEIKNRLERI